MTRHSAFVVCLVISSARLVSAGQVTLDGSYGTSGTLTGPNYSIPDTVGKTVGKNLFHSFSQFNLSSGDVATFSGPNSIQNILTRVTGGSASTIDGTIQSTIPGANFFLINPKGIIFGQNAQLDVSGSFTATTADYIKLADGTRFVAMNPTAAADALLTTASPVAFGFLGPTAAPITLQGGDPNLGEPLVNLQVAAEKSMTFVGGDIEIIHGALTAPSGRINCISVASAGELVLPLDDLTAPVDTSGFAQLGNITIRDFSELNASGDIRSGGLAFHGQDITVRDGSQIWSDNYGSGNGLGIEFIARDSLSFFNGFYTSALAFGAGNGSSIRLQGRSVVLDGGPSMGSIGCLALGSGNAGNITFAAESLVVRNGVGVSSVSIDSNGGDIDITARTVLIDGAENRSGFVATVSGGTGTAGNINIQSDSLTILNDAGIMSDSLGLSPGGTIHIETGSLTILVDGYISAATESPFRGGNIEIVASRVLLDGQGSNPSPTLPTGITARSKQPASGTGGSIHITADSVDVRNGATITASTELFTTGEGGTVEIDAKHLTLQNEGSIQSSSLGAGNAGGISLHIADDLLLKDNATISVSSAQSDAGNIELEVGNVVYLFKSQITASAKENGGNILIDPKVVALNQSQITANAINGNGGNITIVSDFFLNSASLIQAKTDNQFALQGSVQVVSPDVDLSGTLVPLTTKLQSEETKLRERCAVRLPGGASSFIVAGRGGIPIEPDGFIPSMELRGVK